MKIEKRGKYPGVKVHLEPAECQVFLDTLKDAKQANIQLPITPSYFSLSLKLGKKIEGLISEDPRVMVERTAEEVEKVVEAELITATKKMEALKGGGDWKQHTKATVMG